MAMAQSSTASRARITRPRRSKSSSSAAHVLLFSPLATAMAINMLMGAAGFAAVMLVRDPALRAEAVTIVAEAAKGGCKILLPVDAVVAGADLLAVISAVFDAPDVRAAARAFSALFPTEATGDAIDVRTQPRAV